MSGWAYAGLKCSPRVISTEILREGHLISFVDKMWNCQSRGNAAVLIIFGVFMPESFHHGMHFAACHFPASQQMSPQSAHTLQTHIILNQQFSLMFSREKYEAFFLVSK